VNGMLCLCGRFLVVFREEKPGLVTAGSWVMFSAWC